ncbi:carboxy-S-adenosyl-L-methionine synthase CmoA [Pseudocolwellia agarivorans]|uniref:carboxy-S-adenosyl-L-methionine synthase CmoA n=1 Tax=Pseudocolwellia agarivorans TaxID=1911682 RepID=UPI000986D3BF|nr:carboxy-S-adenosyl-L-methionine synthase CmoA [Pseudocolwellia agarivorans]
MINSDTDLIFSSKKAQIQDFAFDKQVVEVFPDMISRSVPGYNTIINTIGNLSKEYAQANTNIYDLGCSLGAATLAMKKSITVKNCSIIGIDNSSAMVERCKMHVNAFKGESQVEICEGNILDIELKNASMVVLNFTLQFIEPEARKNLIQKIYNGLQPGGILVLSEKLKASDNVCNELLIDLHHNFKRENGYSELEIAQKRTAIENVMRPDTLETHLSRLKDSGFNHVNQWFQCFNFMSLVAIK